MKEYAPIGNPAKRLTKRQASYLRQENWKRALADGRIVRFGEGETLRSYPTVDAAEQAVRDSGEYPAVIIRSHQQPHDRRTDCHCRTCRPLERPCDCVDCRKVDA